MLFRGFLASGAVVLAIGCAQPVAPRGPEETGERAVLTNWVSRFQSGSALLAADRARLEAALATCPGPPEPVRPSLGNPVRDALRLGPTMELRQRISEDTGREERLRADRDLLQALTHISAADWYLRRAAATRDERYCGVARDALSAGATLIADADEAARAIVTQIGLP